jgi:preprotein translocase subunit SecE
MADKIKVVFAAFLLIAGIAAFYYYSNQPMVARVGMVLAGIAAGLAVGWTSESGRQLQGFVRQAIEEAKKVVWPTRKESFQTAAIVFAFVVVMALFLWVVDKLLEWGLYDLVLGWK